MTDDALGLFQQMRPPSPALSPEIRRSAGNLPAGAPDLHSLAMVPGTPGYNSRIPKPPCYRCGEDHHPNTDYGHPWEGEPVHDEPVTPALSCADPRPTHSVPVRGAPGSQQRVALYVGRGDTYVVSVEMGADWDAVRSFKVAPDQVMPLVNLARALGVKIADKTGGDMVMLEQEHDDARREPTQDNVRSTASDGDREPRRQGPDANRTKEDKPGKGVPAAG